MTTKSLAVLLGTIFVGAALLATQSRMGLFAGVVGSAVAVGLGGSKLSLRGRSWALGISVVLLGVVLLLLMFGGVLERVGSLESSADVRGALYQEVWEMIWARPWLGYGGGSFETAFPLVHHAPVSPDLLWDKTHDTYLALWSELGLIAGSIPILIVAALVLRTFVAFWRSTSAWSIPLAAIGVVIAGALHSTVDFSLEIQADTYFFLAVLALGLAGEEHGSAGRKSQTAGRGAVV
jgi:O-antigen ligase